MTENLLPIGDGLPQDAIEARFGLYETPDGMHPSWAFSMAVPRGWRMDDVPPLPSPLPSDQLTPLALFANAPEEGGYLQVQAIRLQRDITAEHWIRYYMLLSDYQPLEIRALSPIFADSLCSFAIEGVEFTGRLAVTLRADTLFMVFAFAPTPTYPAWAETFGFCVASFEPKAVLRHPGAESWEAWQAGRYRFECPASWEGTPAHTAPAGVAAVDLIYAQEGNPVGWIRFKSVARDAAPGAEQLIARALADMEDAGVGGFTQRVQQGLDLEGSGFTGGVLQAYDAATSTGAPQEVWVTLLEAPDAYVVISLLTPHRRADFMLWAENRRAYGIITETLAA